MRPATSGRERLVTATRQLMLAVGTTDVADVRLREVATRLEALVPTLARRTMSRVPAPTYEESVGAGAYYAAALNPGLAPVDMSFADGCARARLVLDSLYEGPRGCVHGGVLSYLMDTLLASLVQHEGHLCVTASLTVDYHARTPLRAPLDLAADVKEVRRRSLLVVGTIAHAGQVTVTAQGLFVQVPQR